MSLADYEVMYGSAETATLQDRLPVTAFSVTFGLNAPGSFQVSLPMEAATRTDLLGLASGTNQVTLESGDLWVGESCIFIERNGTPIFCGIVWAISGDLGTGKLTLSGSGVGSYLHRRVITSDSSYKTTDQALIAEDLVYQATSSDSFITVPVADLTGVTRDRFYPGEDLKSVGEAVDQLANVINGFDYYFQPLRNGTSGFTNEFEIEYPAGGTDVDAVFDINANMISAVYSVDGGRLANRVHLLGAGRADGASDRSMLVTETVAASHPDLDAVVTLPDVRNKGTLENHAERLIVDYSTPVEKLRVQTMASVHPEIGDFKVGDRVIVRGGNDAVSFDSERWRVTSLRLDVAGDRDTMSTELVNGISFPVEDPVVTQTIALRDIETIPLEQPNNFETTWTFTLPDDIQGGDHIEILYGLQENSERQPCAVPSGWSSRFNFEPSTFGVQTPHIGKFYKTAAGSAGATSSDAGTTVDLVFPTTTRIYGRIRVWSGVDSSSPYVTSYTGPVNGSSDPDPAAITTDVDGAMITLDVAGSHTTPDNPFVTSYPSSFTAVGPEPNSVNFGGFIDSYFRQETAGALNPSAYDAKMDNHTSITDALRPATV